MDDLVARFINDKGGAASPGRTSTGRSFASVYASLSGCSQLERMRVVILWRQVGSVVSRVMKGLAEVLNFDRQRQDEADVAVDRLVVRSVALRRCANKLLVDDLDT